MNEYKYKENSYSKTTVEDKSIKATFQNQDNCFLLLQPVKQRNPYSFVSPAALRVMANLRI